MIRLFFSLRFHVQLRRTRPDLHSSLEKSIIAAITAAGGTIGNERRSISGTFDEDAVGFWASLVTLLDAVLNALSGITDELYGHVLIIGRDLSSDDGLRLIRDLPIGGTGVWCDSAVRQALSPYIEFNAPSAQPGASSRLSDFGLMKRFIFPIAKNRERLFPYRAKILELLNLGPPRNAALIGRLFIGKRDGLRRYLAQFQPVFPLLVVCFGSGGTGLACFADALAPEMAEFIRTAASDAEQRELAELQRVIIRERFRDEYSEYLLAQGRRFIECLLDRYCRSVEKRGAKPILALENIDQADMEIQQLFLSVYQQLPAKDRLLVYGTWVPQEEEPLNGRAVNRAAWTAVFPRILQISSGAVAIPPPPAFPPELWEIAYTLYLFRRYFPPSQQYALLSDSLLTFKTLSWALDFLATLGIFDFPEDPQPRIPNFAARAEQILGERKERIRSMVWVRMVAQVNNGTYSPCFALVRFLTELGGAPSDSLFLDAILSDVLNKTYKKIEEAIDANEFLSAVGPSRFPSLLYIFTAYKALVHGSGEEIQEAFQRTLEEESILPAYRAQISANQAGYCLGIQDIPAAMDAIKMTIMCSQNQKGGERGLAQGYRLFSLAHLAAGRLEDSVEYSSFAVENAQRSGNLEELAVTAYYASSGHLLFGNVHKAGGYAEQSDQVALSAGRLEWAYRARFLLGRIRFESGLYEEARDIFQNLQRLIGSPESEMTLSAWIYRCDVYIPGAIPKKPAKMNVDARLFEIEAAYFSGNYQEAVALAERLRKALPDTGFIFIEQPDWRSGFSQCELLLFPLPELYTRIIATYWALSKSRLSLQTESFRQEAQEGMQHILREERLFQTDPYDSFYFFSQYLILEETGATENDANTAISIASRYLQKRASRINDEEAKRLFLTRNYWNNGLFTAAKKHNLV